MQPNVYFQSGMLRTSSSASYKLLRFVQAPPLRTSSSASYKLLCFLQAPPLRTGSSDSVCKTFPKPSYQICNTMKHIFISISKPNKSRKTLLLILYFMIFGGSCFILCVCNINGKTNRHSMRVFFNKEVVYKKVVLSCSKS